MAETKSQERLNALARGGAFGSSAPIRRQTDVAPPAKTKIERTSAGLRDALFDAMERVRDQEMAPEDAKAFSGLAHQIVATVNLEIAVAKLRTEYPADAKLVVPAPLPLGAPEEKK